MNGSERPRGATISSINGFFRHRDRVFALVLLVLASVFYGLIGGMEEPYSPGALAASTYPRLILACIIVLSCLLVIRPTAAEARGRILSAKGLAVTLLAAGYIFLLEALGFFVLAPVFLFVVPLVLGYRHHLANAISAVAVTVVLYAVFVVVLKIPLPAGLLGG